eukprot:5621203-Pyramimonas_sp.AAC.1
MPHLRVKRHRGTKARQLFLSMGRVRSHIANCLVGKRTEVGSSGLGGVVSALKSEHEPIELAQFSMADDALTVSINIFTEGLCASGLENQGAAIRAAAD